MGTSPVLHPGFSFEYYGDAGCLCFGLPWPYKSPERSAARNEAVKHMFWRVVAEGWTSDRPGITHRNQTPASECAAEGGSPGWLPRLDTPVRNTIWA